MNKEVQEILNILKCYNNTIQTKFVSVIFENLKLKYELPPIYHKSIDLTCFSKIFEIDNKLYEFFFYSEKKFKHRNFNDSDSEKVIIFFHKIKEVNEIKKDLEYLKNYFNDDVIDAKLQQILNTIIKGGIK